MPQRHLDRLTPVDAAFLHQEGPVSHMHIGGVTIVEGPVEQHDMAQFALIELRGAGRLHLGGFFEDGQLWALTKTADAEQARSWFADTGFWKTDALTTRPLLHVL